MDDQNQNQTPVGDQGVPVQGPAVPPAQESPVVPPAEPSVPPVQEPVQTPQPTSIPEPTPVPPAPEPQAPVAPGTDTNQGGGMAQ